MYRHFDDLTTLGLGSGHERKTAVLSLTPPPCLLSRPVARSGHPMPLAAWPRLRHRTTCAPAPALNLNHNTSNTLAESDTRSKQASAARSAGPPLVVGSSQLLLLVSGTELACSGPKASKALCVCRLVRTSGNHFSTPKRGTLALCIRPLRGVSRARSHGRLCLK